MFLNLRESLTLPFPSLGPSVMNPAFQNTTSIQLTPLERSTAENQVREEIEEHSEYTQAWLSGIS
jgi:hypothetical protein